MTKYTLFERIAKHPERYHIEEALKPTGQIDFPQCENGDGEITAEQLIDKYGPTSKHWRYLRVEARRRYRADEQAIYQVFAAYEEHRFLVWVTRL
jgi:hypothetical protein